MSGGTHMAAGALAGAAAAVAAGGVPWQGVAVGAMAALLPDFDHPKARVWKLVSLALLLGTVGAFAAHMGGTPSSALVALVGGLIARHLVPRTLGHRGPTHSLLFALALAVFVLATAGAQVGAATAAGYGSHLLLDALTPAGVPLAWPVVRSRLRIAVVPEWIVVGSLIASGATIFYWG